MSQQLALAPCKWEPTAVELKRPFGASEPSACGMRVCLAAIWAQAREFLQANTKPAGPIYEGILARKHTDVPTHGIYARGFP